MYDRSPGGLAFAEPADLDDEFDLDVTVLVTLDPVGRTPCPTDDGCGNTCSGSSSACNSAMNALS
ncbi:FxLD family lanthipeptide [Actinocorallia sp. API 0066]|uniref:FxLD family lanthipeptide n=1 Tax=Actinocorallia sp. API 0066 TaxID=2896846 RepID=UPI001E301B5F|nr:FxLD family lanthipeptide [Actinocorallia sp. API 0066]MCD0449334.1 FxLD family lanthipeptide [Actinocorallia sp. API 0066]